MEKSKKWWKEKSEKGKEFLKDHKGVLCFGAGMIFVSALSIASEKINEPVSGCIKIDPVKDDSDSIGIANIYTQNRFGKTTKLLSIRYETEKDGVSRMYDALSEIIHPED